MPLFLYSYTYIIHIETERETGQQARHEAKRNRSVIDIYIRADLLNFLNFKRTGNRQRRDVYIYIMLLYIYGRVTERCNFSILSVYPGPVHRLLKLM